MRDERFLITDECIRLARWLRLMGFDAVTATARPLSELYRLAYNESRVVVTRNGQVKASGLFRVVHLESQQLEGQLTQLLRDLRLRVDEEKTCSRCDRCNVAVRPIAKTDVQDRVPPYVFQTQQTYTTCPSCTRIYWSATHRERMKRVFDRVTTKSGSESGSDPYT